ncbi:DUF4124 domain-containing protein [Luminiphilus sp.]|nr:DUF4124 domain-containing protein [Luminiphilus sp.]
MIKIANGLVIAIFAIAVLNTLPLRAEIFKYTDKNGNTVFSDKPPVDNRSERVLEIELGPTNLSEPPPKLPTPSPEATNSEAAVKYTTSITSPDDGTTVPMGPGDFIVTALFSPPLAAGDLAVVKLDGEIIAPPQRRNSWQLRNIFRGEHKITIERQNAESDVLSTSPPITVYVLRPSIR